MLGRAVASESEEQQRRISKKEKSRQEGECVSSPLQPWQKFPSGCSFTAVSPEIHSGEDLLTLAWTLAHRMYWVPLQQWNLYRQHMGCLGHSRPLTHFQYLGGRSGRTNIINLAFIPVVQIKRDFQVWDSDFEQIHLFLWLNRCKATG